MHSLNFTTGRIKETLEFLPESFFDDFWSDAKLKMKEIQRFLMEGFLEYEVEHFLGAHRYQRVEARIGYRNGFYPRKTLVTDAFGELNGFKVPRVRGAVFKSRILHRYQRHTKEIWQAILTMYINGQSVRRVSKTLHKLFGIDMSRSTISEMLQKTQEKLDSWRRQPITGNYVALVLDGLYINLRTGTRIGKKINRYGRFAKNTKGVILAVMGIKEDGTKEIITFKLGRSESKAEWDGLINDALNRGLKLPISGLLIHDGAAGIAAAVESAFPFQKKQLCVFHYIQTVSSKARNLKEKTQVQKDLSFVYEISNTQKVANASFNNFIRKWLNINPSVARYVRDSFLQTITYLDYDKHMHSWLRTSNYLERAFKQINRKTYDVGVFPNIRSAERIVFLQILDYNHTQTGEVPFYA